MNERSFGGDLDRIYWSCFWYPNSWSLYLWLLNDNWTPPLILLQRTLRFNPNSKHNTSFGFLSASWDANKLWAASPIPWIFCDLVIPGLLNLYISRNPTHSLMISWLFFAVLLRARGPRTSDVIILLEITATMFRFVKSFREWNGVIVDSGYRAEISRFATTLLFTISSQSREEEILKPMIDCVQAICFQDCRISC